MLRRGAAPVYVSSGFFGRAACVGFAGRQLEFDRVQAHLIVSPFSSFEYSLNLFYLGFAIGTRDIIGVKLRLQQQ